MPGDAEYGLLGPLTVRRGGAEVPIAADKQRVVLAALLLRGGQSAGIDELAEALWDDRPPPSARATIQNYVFRLRQALGPGGDAVIVTEPDGYRIDLGPGELDVDRFEAALAAGRAAARAGDWADAAAVLREGLALWRGEPLAGIGSEFLLSREGPRLAELRWQATEALAGAELHLGRHREMIAGLRQAVAEAPLRERLHALLITALYRDGQQAAALAAYQAARNVLAAELGADPGPELQALHQRILSAAPAPAAPAPATPPPEPGGLDTRYALPPDAAAFTGREAELGAITAAVTSAAAAGQVVAIRAIGGMPGAGKTALAVHAAHRLAGRFPDRQLFVSLHGHTPGQDPVAPDDALAGLLAATGLDPRALPGDLEGRAALWRHRMAAEKALIVLDNAASSAQVAPLLPGSAGCLVLVTSRRYLGDLPGAVPILLEALPPVRAAEMFVRLAPGATAPRELVAELTELAGHLPLAISLLARVSNRHPSWTLADLAAETRARLLTMTAERDSVAAAFEISYQHLPAARQRFFRLLGLHPGTAADVYAAAALAGVPLAEAARHLDALHGEGLLTETSYRRYGMHDLIRRYARGLAADPAQDAAAVDRLLDYYQHAAACAEARLSRQTRPRPPPAVPAGLPAPDLDDDGRALAWGRAERASLLACLDQAEAAGQHARVIALTTGIAGLLRRDGPWAEAVTRHGAAVRAAERLGDLLGQAGALSDLGDAQQLTGDYPAAAQAQEQALSIYRDLGDRRGQANALTDLGTVRWATGDYPAASGVLEEALGIFRELGERRGEANALRDIGTVRWLTSDYPAAARMLEQALGIYRDLGDLRGQSSCLSYLGAVRLLTSDYPAAARLMERSLDGYRDLGDRRGQASVLSYLAVVRRRTGDYPAATRLLDEALGIFGDLGHRLGQANTLHGLGMVRRLTDDYPAAARAQEQALRSYRDLGDRVGQANALRELGAVRRQTGDLPAAALALEEGLAICRDIGDRAGEGEVLNERGTLHRVSGEITLAEDCHRQALEVARDISRSEDEAHSLAGLGRCASAAGRVTEARSLLRQALEIFRRIGAAEVAGLAAELEAVSRTRPPR